MNIKFCLGFILKICVVNKRWKLNLKRLHRHGFRLGLACGFTPVQAAFEAAGTRDGEASGESPEIPRGPGGEVR